MDSNGNQRKRAARIPKNSNTGEKSPPKNIEHEVLEVSAVNITHGESESRNNAPASECRRSSRKKIIKFDVRDLLNKNRKTHKIQIEARIDSNTPNTSKAATAGGIATANSKTSLTTSREDLLSKHKTFLEKSAIFRRYSVSQEQKAPPPPLPIPPLLGKANDNKDSGFSGTSSCQEFLSHALIKPKQPTSLIIAQIESNKPSSVATTKRKSLYKSLDMNNKFMTISETSPVVQQKKRGRPAKNKTQTSIETVVTTSAQEECAKKEITPEKAKNWKEYKACLAQQSSSTNEEQSYKVEDKAFLISKQQKDEAQILVKKQDEVEIFDDTLQSDISRSDDDGNFSGFHTSKDDVSCDSPVLTKLFSASDISIKEDINKLESSENINNEVKFAFKDVESKSSMEPNEIKEPTFKTKLIGEDKFTDKNEKQNFNPGKLETENLATLKPEVTNETKIHEENQSKNSTVETFDVEKLSNRNSPDFTQRKESKTEIENTIGNETNPPEEKNYQYKPPGEAQNVQKSRTASQESEIIINTNFKQQIENKRCDLMKENIKDIATNSEKVENNKTEKIQDEVQKTILETKKICGTSDPDKDNITTCVHSSINFKKFETVHETEKELKTLDVLSKSAQIVEECTPHTKQSVQQSSSSDESKSFSRTSSSSESENASDRSSCSSEPFSTTSSSSPRSYKSGDKLKVSIKRIPLPKSPSTSSQTSTSEEFNNADVLKRKPPMSKRSKRLQKKFNEALDDEDATENINDCFQRIPNDDSKLKLNIDERISIEDISNSEIYANTSKASIKEVDTNESVKKIVAEEITTTDSYEASNSSEIANTLSNESSNVEFLLAKEKVIKRKSLRNRNDCSIYTKDEGTGKPKSKGKESPPEEIKINQQKIIANESEEVKQSEQNLLNRQKKTSVAGINLESSGSDQIDKNENNEKRKRLKKVQSSTQLGKKQLGEPSSIDIEQSKGIEETKTQAENVFIEKANENKMGMLNEEIIVQQGSDTAERTTENISKAATVRGITSKEDQSGVHADLKHKDDQKVEPISKDVEVRKRDKTMPPAGRSTDQEASTNRKTNTEEVFIKESENLDGQFTKYEEEICAKDRKLKISSKSKGSKKNETISEVVQQENMVRIQDTTKSPNPKLTRFDKEKVRKIATIRNKTNKDEKHCDDEEKEIQENTPITEIIQVPISGNTSIAADKEQTADNPEKDSIIIPTGNKISKEVSLANKTETLKENDENLKEFSTKHEKDKQIPEMMVVEISGNIQDKTKTLSEILRLTSEIVGDDKSEKVVTISTRSRRSKEEISTKELTHSATQMEDSTKDEIKKVETSLTADISKTLKEDLLTTGNQLKTTEISSANSEFNKKEYSTEVSKTNEDKMHKADGILLKVNLEDKETEKSTIKQNETETETKTKTQCNKLVLLAANTNDLTGAIQSTKNKPNKEETSPITRKRSTLKIGSNSPKLFSSSSENLAKSTTELTSCCSSTKTSTKMFAENSNSFQDTNLAVENQTTEQSPATTSTYCVKPHSSKKTSPKLSTTKTIFLKHADCSKPSQEENLVDKSQETTKASDTIELTKQTCEANALQKNPLQAKNEKIMVGHIVTKRRGRKSRFKNLHGREVDSETDSSNGKSTPIDEVTHQKSNTETKRTEKEIVKDKELQSPQILSETDTKVCEIVKEQEDVNFKEEPVSIQESGQPNLFRSQIKNVSIETNTLLDILRTVQSNTEAALKATKSPTDIDRTDYEHTIESTTKVQFDEPPSTDLLKIQRETEAISPTQLDTESSLIVNQLNLSPARSDSASPLTVKKMAASPTRSNSSSPLTLKKGTRRYERRSRRAEDSAHKTLEETFAEIAAQSSKAVLAAQEFDINEEQIKNEKCEKELEFVDTVPNVDKEQFKENLAELEKTSGLGELPFSAEDKVDSILLNVSQHIDTTPVVAAEVDINPIESVIEVEVETSKFTPAKRGRKPKNRPLDAKQAEPQETLEINNSPKVMEGTTITKEVVKEKVIQSETEVTANERENENKSEKVNESVEKTEIGDFSERKSSLPLLTYQEVGPKEPSNLSQMPIEESLKQLENVSESKLSKQIKKRDDKTVLDENTCQDKEDEVRTPKQPIKKRDSSLSKSETKSVVKKLPNKTKNEEEDSVSLQKEETLTKTASTTPPPSKRGRKPKNQQHETPQTSSKKKNKNDICAKNDEEDINLEKEKLLDSENEALNTSSEKSLDEKLAKKKRQRKLKEAFEAALTDDKEKCKKASQTETCSPKGNSTFGLTLFNNSPPPEKSQSIFKEEVNETIKLTCITPVVPEEDLDPLKDIEKFIADGVNLLKKDYKLDEDSVDDVMQTTAGTTKIIHEPLKNSAEETKNIFNTFETPADTPINTPSVTPPPKSPTSIESTTPDENSGVRRSHRIKLITKTPKALVGRGLVRDRERFSIKDDVETKSHYTMDDHLTDLAEVEAKNAKFLKEMEERLSNFQVIKENDYLCEHLISREARKMICDCFLTHEEEERGELGCGEDCLNRLLMIECGPECNVKERCTNKRFQTLLCSPCRVFRTEKKGFGIMADIEILPGEFIMEYVGEVIDTEEFEKRRIIYSQDKNRHYYFMALRSGAIIDATIKGNISRFINHSCDPNAETQKWTVNGELRIGFFSRKSIMPGEEITFNYQYQRYGREAQRCYCESVNCRGWIGQEPTSDEAEQMYDEDDESEDEEEEADTSNLLVHDDDEDSDTSVADPEEVQKQLEMAAAQAEVELAPLRLLEGKIKQVEATSDEGKTIQDLNKSGNEEDSKSKFKKLLSKMAEKVAAKQKQNKREQKLQRKKKSKESSSVLTNKLRFLEDPDIEDEVEFLKECGLKNQSDTLRLSRLIVRAKLLQTRLNLLEILRKGDFPCRRLFLDYHGLRLLHGWMSEDAGNMQIRLSLLQTLETLPIANKTVLTDSKVMQVVRNWCGTNTNLSPNEDSSSSNSNSQDASVQSSTNFEEGSELAGLQKLALKLITTWDGLPEIFRIPKKERIEQMKEHEREADRQYAANSETQENTTATDRYRRDRFGRGLNTPNNTTNSSNRFVKPNNGNPHKTSNATPENLKNLSKAQRREMFAAKVARDEAEKRLAEERREFETKCRFFGLDPKKTRPQDIPFCVNPATGQWFSIERKPIPTPPSYAHVKVPVKPKSTDPNDYQLPAVCSTLPSQWKYAITPQGKIYYYHIKDRISQWEPPSAAQFQQCELEDREEDSESEISTTAAEDSSDDDDDILVGMDAAQLKAYIDRKVDMRRQKRYQRLVDQRSISPRREEDRIYNQLEVRKYKENKEKIRKRKEDIRRKRAEALRQTSLNMCTLGSVTDTNPNASNLNTENDGELGALPIQDYLLSSDEEIDLKAEVNSPLIDKIVEGDKIVDELDALTSKRQLKRPLPPHRNLNEPSTSFSSASTSVTNTLVSKQEYKKRKLEKKEKRKPKEQDAKYRKNKEKFRCEIAGIIVHHLKPYLKETCTLARILSNEDFNHLARKLTHFVMIKELKYCESVGQTLVVTESVKSKSREFIKKYMAKYGDVYIKPANDPDFKDIPFTL